MQMAKKESVLGTYKYIKKKRTQKTKQKVD